MLYRFKGGSDGQYPQGLLAINGVLYATTYIGGSGKCALGCGTIFKMDASGEKTVLYDFKAPPDGAEPHARLAFANGKLYGTTVAGGPYCPYEIPSGCGTVFSISP
ncbi:MAG: choice-of-anchor tandem repeat GloVer-containing protein [Candidatus Cybelea sp.]